MTYMFRPTICKVLNAASNTSSLLLAVDTHFRVNDLLICTTINSQYLTSKNKIIHVAIFEMLLVVETQISLRTTYQRTFSPHSPVSSLQLCMGNLCVYAWMGFD